MKYYKQDDKGNITDFDLEALLNPLYIRLDRAEQVEVYLRDLWTQSLDLTSSLLEDLINLHLKSALVSLFCLVSMGLNIYLLLK